MTEKPLKRKRGKVILFILLGIVTLTAGFFLISGYVKTLPAITWEYYTGDAEPAPYPDVRFAVLSDLHYYDTSLGTEGAAFLEVFHSDRKLLLESRELLERAISEIEGASGLTAAGDGETGNSGSGPQFVLVSGDLTKDGERTNHEQVASRLQQLVGQGVQVFVVPGNHDVNNPGAVRYVGDSTEPVDTVSADEFAEIYANMGYGGALLRDGDSLSYVAEPVPGLWIVGLDSCRYRENQPGQEEIFSGKISQETERWLAGVLAQALDGGKAVMVLTHHGVVEHWQGQAKLHPAYLIQDYRYMGRMLASWNVRLVFTGHYHAQDIVYGEFARGSLYDVETGSLVTPSCPVRFCSLTDNVLTVETMTLIDRLRPGTDYAERATAFARENVISEAYGTLRSYKVSETNARYIAEAVGDGFMAHYSGDEDPAAKPPFDESRLNLWGRIIFFLQKYIVDGIRVDLPPGDNNVTLPLR